MLTITKAFQIKLTCDELACAIFAKSDDTLRSTKGILEALIAVNCIVSPLDLTTVPPIDGAIVVVTVDMVSAMLVAPSEHWYKDVFVESLSLLLSDC